MFRMFSLCFKTENHYLIFLAVRLIPLKYYKIYLSLRVEKKMSLLWFQVYMEWNAWECQRAAGCVRQGKGCKNKQMGDRKWVSLFKTLSSIILRHSDVEMENPWTKNIQAQKPLTMSSRNFIVCIVTHRKPASHLKIGITVDLKLGSLKFFQMSIVKEKVLFLGQKFWRPTNVSHWRKHTT